MTGLGRSAFELRVGGTPVSIERVGGPETAPLNLALAVSIPDLSMDEAADVGLQAARFAHRTTGGHGSVLLVTAAVGAPGWQPDAGAIAESIPERRMSGPDLTELLSTALSSFEGRRGRSALVVVSDGGDADLPKSAWKSAQSTADAAGVPVFVIGLRDAGFPSRARGNLGRLADTTGGRSYFLGDPSMLEMTLDYVGELIRGSYALQYVDPRAGSSGPQTIKVEVASRGAEVDAPRKAR